MSESLQVTSLGSYEICLTSDQGSFSVYKPAPNDFDPQTTFFKCDKTKSGGVMFNILISDSKAGISDQAQNKPL